MLLASRSARATPVPLPFTYPYETLQKGEGEDELYGDMTPLRVLADPTQPNGGRLWEPGYVLQNELEYGVSDRVELAWYQVFEANPQDGGGNTMLFDGFKYRARIRLAEAGEWPVDVALYIELETLHDEMSLEEKVILAKRFGRLHWMANLWVEEEMNRPWDDSVRNTDFVINPTMGFTYEFAPWFQPGVEDWARGTFGGSQPAAIDRQNAQVHNFVGPTLHFDMGKFWFSVGAYVNCNDVNKPDLGAIYGPVWVRTLLGITL
jgi:hypothetical protein